MLSKQDKRILEYIKRYMIENGTTPTIRDICKEFCYYSSSSAHVHFKRLVDLGYIEQVKGNSFRYKVKGMRYIEDAEDKE